MSRPLAGSAPCPCGGGSYGTCCAPAHRGETWPETAEALMRSRYAAFARGLDEYLLRTWHPRIRPAAVDLDDTTWTGLDVREVVDGNPWQSDGIVEFDAHWRRGRTARGTLTERSSFERRAGRWFYVAPC